MPKNLVIVESPGKLKKIGSFLGPDWIVQASVGHIKDLPNKEFGVDTETWKETYEPTERGRSVISNLRKHANGADTVWLATDLDREGEAIAWHLQGALQGTNTEFKRIVFNEITKKAVTEAIEQPRKLDYNLVNAQRGRRILDRITGYGVSPVLSQAIGQNASAGRVQSLAVKLISERERAIDTFEPTQHFAVRYFFSAQGTTWAADLDLKPFLDNSDYLLDNGLAQKLSTISSFTVESYTPGTSRRKPPAPFITSTMQKAASNVLNLSAKQTMQAAQLLYEAGHITYMRTDSTALSDEAVADIEAVLSAKGLGDDIQVGGHSWGSNGAAQEAHEAIRPSSASVESVELGTKPIEKAAAALYSLIWQQALCSRLKAAEYATSTAKLDGGEFNGKPVKAIGKGRSLTYKGWLTFIDSDRSEVNDDANQEQGTDEGNPVPVLDNGMSLNSDSSSVLEKMTKAPKRYTEASLVNALENAGVGRPATYAAIIENIKNRGYCEVKKRFFHATPFGHTITDAMDGCMPFMAIEYTSSVEDELDLVAKGQCDFKGLLNTAWSDLKDGIQKLEVFKPSNQIMCAVCNEFPMKRIVPKDKKKRPFWVCSDDTCKTYCDDLNGEPFDPSEFAVDCPECSVPLRRITTAKGAFWGCPNFKSKGCKVSMDDKDGKPVERVVHECPAEGCNGHLVKSKVKPGAEKKTPFWFCSNWNASEPCSYKSPDRRGKPLPLYSCPECSNRLLPGTSREGGKQWYCTGHKQGCKFTTEDKRGKPLLT